METNIIIINLQRSSDRKDKLIKKLNEINITNYYIFPAFDGYNINNLSFNPKISYGYRQNDEFKKGEIGIILSHISALKFAQMNKWQEVIILEDDVELCVDFKERYKLLKKEIPFDWEQSYLSGINFNPNPLNKITNHLYKSVFMMGLHSYVVRNIAYNKIINQLMKFDVPADDAIANLVHLNELKSYTFVPFFTYQNDKYSFIWNSEDNKEPVTINHFKNKLND